MNAAESARMGLQSVNGVIALGVAIGFLIVAFIVKGTRPDAFGLSIGSSAIGIFNAFFGFVWMMMMPALIRGSRSGQDIASLSSVIGLFRGVLMVASGVLMMMAIAKLAKPPVQEGSTPFAQGRYQ